MASEQGYSNQKKKGTPQFKTIHSVNSNAFAESVVSKSLYDISVSANSISAVTEVFGSTGQVAYWQITSTSHGAIVGNVVRILTNALTNFEFDVISVVDTDNFLILPISPTIPLTSDTFKVMGWVTSKVDSTGTPIVTVTTTPPVNGVVDAGNSSVIALGAGGVFTGAAVDVTTYAAINVCVASNVASATNGIKVEFSQNNVNWDHSHQTTYPGTTGIGYIFNAEFKYARVVYTNSGTAQAYFRLQTILKSNPVQSSLFTLDQIPTGSSFAPLTKSAIIGKTTGGGGGFVDVKVNPSGALTVEADVTGTVSVSNFPATQNTAEQTQSGTITQIQKTVGLTAVRATVSGSAPSVTRKRIMIKPSKNNLGTIYLGSSAVTISSGLEIIGPDRLEFLLDSSDYYLISDTAAQTVEIVEVV